MNRRAAFDWARPAVRASHGERLRSYAYGRSLSGAVYPLASAERQTDSGLQAEGGLTLVLSVNPGLRPGDLLRRSGAAAPVYRVDSVREWPAHTEAVLRETPVTAEGEPYGE